MDEKLRRWLGSRCRAQPDGTWLVDPAVFLWPPSPPFILPDEAAKEAYLARAVRLGRFNVGADFAQLAPLFLFMTWTTLSRAFGIQNDLGLVIALGAISAIAPAILLYWVVPRREAPLRSWLHRTGREAGVDAARSSDQPGSGSRFNPRGGLRRCRPGWMVVADAAVLGAAAGATTLVSVRTGYDCKQAQDAWWAAGGPWSAFPGKCIGLHSVLMLIAAVAVLVLMIGMVRDWWRWNMREAATLADPD